MHMYEEDIQLMKDLVKLHPAKETGGNLFGLWNNNEEPVLHVVLGPAVIIQKVNFLKRQSVSNGQDKKSRFGYSSST